MIDKKQSSINFLKSKLITRQNTHIIHGEEVIFIRLEKLNKLFEQAKAMHKEEIETAWDMVEYIGISFAHRNIDEIYEQNAEQYYNKTYGED